MAILSISNTINVFNNDYLIKFNPEGHILQLHEDEYRDEIVHEDTYDDSIDIDKNCEEVVAPNELWDKFQDF